MAKGSARNAERGKLGGPSDGDWKGIELGIWRREKEGEGERRENQELIGRGLEGSGEKREKWEGQEQELEFAEMAVVEVSMN